MDGKVVVVTGASGALGKAVAEMALARGGKVASVDHAPSQIPPAPDRIELGGVDLSDAAQAKTAIDAAAAHFGRLNALINIAGAFAFETVAEGDPKTWQRMYAINVLTALNASRAALPHLAAASPSARIVNIGAFGALQAGSGMGLGGARYRPRRPSDARGAPPRAGMELARPLFQRADHLVQLLARSLQLEVA